MDRDTGFSLAFLHRSNQIVTRMVHLLDACLHLGRIEHAAGVSSVGKHAPLLHQRVEDRERPNGNARTGSGLVKGPARLA